MIIRMTTRSGRQRRYDHRLQDLVRRTGDLTIATDLGVPRSTARGWLGAAPRVVVSLEAADLTEPELRQEILKLRRRVEKLAALLRLAMALLRASGFRLSTERLPQGEAKLTQTHEPLHVAPDGSRIRLEHVGGELPIVPQPCLNRRVIAVIQPSPKSVSWPRFQSGTRTRVVFNRSTPREVRTCP
jgi:hypothetical protein